MKTRTDSKSKLNTDYLQKLFDDLAKNKDSQNKNQEDISYFTTIPNEVFFMLCKYLDKTSLENFMLSCKGLLFLIFSFQNSLYEVKKKFQLVKDKFQYKNWEIFFNIKTQIYSIEGFEIIPDIQYSRDWEEQIEQEILALTQFEALALCQSARNGVKIEITINLPRNLKFFSLEEIAECLQLPIAPPELTEETTPTIGCDITEHTEYSEPVTYWN